MSDALVLSVDFGSTNCKVLIFDACGNVISSISKPIKVAITECGRGFEINDSEFRSTLFYCIKAATLNIDLSRIQIVTITAQATTTVCLDSKGNVVRPMLSHFDRRADEYGKRIRDSNPQMSYTGLKIGGTLGWMKEFEPTSFNATSRVCDLKEYIGFLLTGEVTRDYLALARSCAKELSDFLSLESETFGTEHNYSRSIGQCKAGIDGLEAGTPVLVCCWDGLSAVVGSGLVEDGLIADIAGSTETIAVPVSAGCKFATRRHIIRSHRLFYTSFPFGIAYDWFKNSLYGEGQNKFQEIERDVLSNSSDPESCNSFFLPVLKTGWLNWDMMGTLVDIDFRFGKAQILQTVMEGITMQVKKTLRPLVRGKVPLKEVRMSGGGGKSDVWNQIRADILNLPIVQLQTVETGCMGAAILGWVTLGEYRNVEDASFNMIRSRKRYEPSPSKVNLYKEKYKEFEKFLDSSIHS